MNGDEDRWREGGPEDGGLGRAERDPPASSGLSCLQVTTQPSWTERLGEGLSVLSGSARRSAYALQQDAIAIVEAWGFKNTLFVTLTFGGGKRGPSVKQAEAAFNSFRSHGLADRFKGGVKVLERGTKNGRVHFHCLLDAGEDVWTGADFGAIERGDLRSLNKACRSAYAWLRQNVVKYGFGRVVDCLPIKSSSEGVARYVSKYISKHFQKRRIEDKRARLRSYWGTARAHRKCSCRFSWAGPYAFRGWLWRAKLGALSKLNGISDSDGWVRKFGPRWAFHISEYVFDFPLQHWPTAAHAAADPVGPDGGFEPGATDCHCVPVVQSQVRERRLLGKILFVLDGRAEEPPSWVDELLAAAAVNNRAKNLGALWNWRVAGDPESKEFRRVLLGDSPTVPVGFESKPKKTGPFGIEHENWRTDPF